MENSLAEAEGAEDKKMAELSPPEELDLKVQKLISIERFGSSYAYVTEDMTVWFKKEDNSVVTLKTIADKKIVKQAINENVRVFITEDGRLHHQGLFDKLRDNSPCDL